MTFDPYPMAHGGSDQVTRVYRLHERPELLRATAELLNSEWSRSLGAREASIHSSCDGLPCSLLLVSRDGGGVVGHARLLPVAGRKDAGLVESVVVSPKLRGRGLGRVMMEASEQHARRIGCCTLHLSTHDQQEFYTHLGYTPGPAVSALRQCLGHLMEEQSVSLVEKLEGQKVDKSKDLPCSSLLPVTPLFPPPPLPPPPPPPPPPPLTLSETQCNQLIWMMKVL